MSVHKEELDKTCKYCNSHLVRVSMKNPWIDDYEVECPKCNPGEAKNRLDSSARSAAKADKE